MKKRVLSILLTVLLIVTAVLPTAAAAGNDDAATWEEGSYVPNEVIVLFEQNTVQKSSAKTELAATGDDFGSMMAASDSEQEAAAYAQSESDILSDSLGNDFVLEDTLAFDAAAGDAAVSGGSDLAPTGAGQDDGSIKIALVSSEKYDTETMIKKLSANQRIAAVEPNPYIYLNDVEEYSLNDTYSSFLYQLNTPNAHNNGGAGVSARSKDADSAMSLHAASGWKQLTDGDREESVVAVIDTGVLDTHEDLKDVMWTNPGNIGLAGEHGYNFCENNEDSAHDDVGHGTHCAGVIAAQANNGVGVAGATAGANVKIMALRILGTANSSTLYTALGAYSYVLSAKLAGVNVVATSNSWGASSSESSVYDEVIDRLGEEGILTYIAAGNSAENIDRITSIPTNADSEYTVVVGAADIEGNPTAFSCYGKSSVDLYAPGMGILSTVGYDCYFPSIYTPDQLRSTTAYYGEFTADTEVAGNMVTPVTGRRADDSVKPFGALQIRRQESVVAAAAGWSAPETEEYELSVVNDRSFSASDDAGALKLTIKNAQHRQDYYVYFPYEKDPETTGDDNTYFSILYESTAGEPNGTAIINAGEVVEEEGSLSLTEGGINDHGISPRMDKILSHPTNRIPSSSQETASRLLSAADAEGKQVGLGIRISTYDNTNIKWQDGETHDLTVYIHSLGISRPGTEIKAEESYEMMSGTSMACPAAAGAGALIAALNPRTDTETGTEYARAIRSRLFSCVTRTDALKDLCSAGGYVDLRHINEEKPSFTDAICDVENDTITLKGDHLNDNYQLSYRRLAVEGAQPVVIPSDRIVFSDDGKTLTVKDARELFGTYTQFILGEDDTAVTASFFLVKGMQKLEPIASKLSMRSGKGNPYFYYLVTDAKGEQLYGYQTSTGVVARFNGKQFNPIDGTEIDFALFDWLEQENILDRYTLYNDCSTGTKFIYDPLCENGKIYQVIYLNFAGGYLPFFATLDLADDDPRWSFSEFEDFPAILDGIYGPPIDSVIMNGKLYCFGGSDNNDDTTRGQMPVCSYDIASNSWTREPDLPYDSRQPVIRQHNGKIYFMFGHDVLSENQNSEDGLSTKVFCFDGESWEQLEDIPFVGRFSDIDGIAIHFEQCAQTKNGLLFIDTAVDGAGNVFLYNTQTGKCEPIDYTLNDTFADHSELSSCVATRDGIYYIKSYSDEAKIGYRLYFIPADSGAYESIYSNDLLGDANLDDEVDITDATVIQRYDVKMIELSDEALRLADVDRDGEVCIIDATWIQRWEAQMKAPEGIGKPIE